MLLNSLPPVCLAPAEVLHLTKGGVSSRNDDNLLLNSIPPVCPAPAEILHLTTISSSYIGEVFNIDQREVYVNTVDNDGNLLDVEKLASPKISLSFQKYSYKTGAYNAA